MILFLFFLERVRGDFSGVWEVPRTSLEKGVT
jgi:hypothetical protein